MRVPAIEAALRPIGSRAPSTASRYPPTVLMSDIHGSSDYGANLIKVMRNERSLPRLIAYPASKPCRRRAAMRRRSAFRPDSDQWRLPCHALRKARQFS